VSYAFDPAAQLAQQVLQALADQSAQPLAEVQERAPVDTGDFSELEFSLGEWGFGYGVAWALVRAADPMMSSQAVAELARRGTALAWRMYSEDSWPRLLEHDRAARRPTAAEPEGGAQQLREQPAPEAEAAAEPEPPEAALSEFMGKVAQTRASRPERGPRESPG
jgi:hypothetical protein